MIKNIISYKNQILLSLISIFNLINYNSKNYGKNHINLHYFWILLNNLKIIRFLFWVLFHLKSIKNIIWISNLLILKFFLRKIFIINLIISLLQFYNFQKTFLNFLFVNFSNFIIVIEHLWSLRKFILKF